MNANGDSFNFDDYIESNFKSEQKEEPIIKIENRWVHYICPVCGHYSLTEDRFPVCNFCKNDQLVILEDTENENIQNQVKLLPPEQYKKYLYFEKSDEYLYASWKNSNKETQKSQMDGIAFREYLRQKYVFNSPLFDKDKYNQRAEWVYQLRVSEDAKAHEKAAEAVAVPHCPQCGCTEFQMIPRKWSPLTGFLTNKVDRVCVRCKTRF